MFYQNSVQSGINTALQQGKSVVCFVTDDGEESQLWEQTWLHDQDLRQELEYKAIVLRIERASQEAEQLSSFYPVNEAPNLLVINQGRLNTHLRSGTSKSSFVSSLLQSLGHSLNHESNSQSTQVQQQTLPGQLPHAANPSTPTSVTPTSTSSALETSEPVVAGNTPNPAESRSTPTASSVTSTHRLQETYALRQARQKREANQERERVRALIEADKRERKARDEQRRQEAREALKQEQREVNDASERRALDQQMRSAQAGSSLQVRLLDGTTVRQRFNATDTLHLAVRKYIDQHRTDEPLPYTFKLILTPQPSRALDDADEGHTLGDLGLVPSASLALVPVRNFTEAYRASGSKGFVRGAPLLLYGYFMTLCAIVSAFVQRLFGQNVRRTSQPSPPSPQAATTGVEDSSAQPANSKIRIKTLHDQADGTQDDQQLYNGNTLNFEPKKKDNEDVEP